jgi:hypothetical protein
MSAFRKNAPQDGNPKMVRIGIGDVIRTHPVNGDHQDRLVVLRERRRSGKGKKEECSFEAKRAVEHEVN